MKLKFIVILLSLFTFSASFAQKKNKDKKAKKVIFLAPVPKEDEEVMMEEPPPPADGMIERAVISNSTDEEPPPPSIEIDRVVTSKGANNTEGLERDYILRQKESRKARYASYPGGEETFNELALARIELPQSAKKFAGYLTVSFLVSKDGELSDFKTNGIFNKDCDTEAERVIRSLGNWDPAINTESQPLDSRVVIKIPFGVEPAPEITIERQNQAFLAPPPPPPTDGSTGDIPAPMLVETPVMVKKISTLQVSDDIFEKNPDTKSSFIDGEAELQRFISKEMIYPYQAYNANVTGTIYFEAIVNKNGDLADFSITKGMDIWQCDDNAITVVKKLPGFIPAKLKGKPVNSKINLEIPCKPL